MGFGERRGSISWPIKKYDVVTVPFTDSVMQKRRPALVLSDHAAFNTKIGHSVMAMITSEKNAPWPLDVRIADLSQAGLPAPSVVRMKLFTLDHTVCGCKSGGVVERRQTVGE